MNGATTDEVRFVTNSADIDEVVRHLEDCDKRFVPPLGTRVDIRLYAAKLLERAMRFEAWHNGRLIGLVAAYGNDRESGAVFITSVSVLDTWTGRGIASRLLQDCIGQACQLGMQRIVLEVSGDNQAAVAFYANHGFTTGNRAEQGIAGPLTMTLTLRNGS
ncbi:GNAT family N-acetyltransferase [Propionivibrio soli]|uniref:GNAT family N-acetyltransferase n=1 Tax=Propionivibrio soli TaxID=2976531 RepID=UPI0021E7E1CE|nr:GNAT family N-acetyltransferase [Propionivibrio soli]